jgi:hypothetical protein
MDNMSWGNNEKAFLRITFHWLHENYSGPFPEFIAIFLIPSEWNNLIEERYLTPCA